MALACYYGGDVKKIAKDNMKNVSKSNRIYLKSIMNSPNPALIVLKALDILDEEAA